MKIQVVKKPAKTMIAAMCPWIIDMPGTGENERK